jgi:hypothetical protein
MIRYSRELIIENIKAVLEGRNLNPADVYGAMDMNRPTWHRKISGERDWSLEELAKLARILGAPPGWPFIPWDHADAVDRLLAMLKEMAKKGEQP